MIEQQCPKCFDQKPLGSTHCPKCTHQVGFGEEMMWNWVWQPLGIVFVIWVIGKILF